MKFINFNCSPNIKTHGITILATAAIDTGTFLLMYFFLPIIGGVVAYKYIHIW